MPSFVCDRCQETLKKPKLDQHAQRCRGASFSCIDCYRSFQGVEYREHYSCITEVEKYEKKKKPAVTQGQGREEQPQMKTTAAKRPAPSAAPIAKEKMASKGKTTPVPAQAVLETIKASSANSLTLKELKKSLKRANTDTEAFPRGHSRREIKRWLESAIVLSVGSDGRLIVSLSE